MSVKKYKITQDVLMGALATGNVFIVANALEEGVSANQDLAGDSLLYHACRAGQIEVVDYLVAKGADVNAPNRKGITPLHAALNPIERDNRVGAALVASFLLKHGANVKTQATDSLYGCHEFGETPLHAAAALGNIHIVEMLLKRGANVNAKIQQTPLHVAADYGKERIVALLLRYRADANTLDRWGRRPVDKCANQAAIVPMLEAAMKAKAPAPAAPVPGPKM